MQCDMKGDIFKISWSKSAIKKKKTLFCGMKVSVCFFGEAIASSF